MSSITSSTGIAMPLPDAQTAFTQFDVDADGMLSGAEYSTLHQQMMTSFQAAGFSSETLAEPVVSAGGTTLESAPVTELPAPDPVASTASAPSDMTAITDILQQLVVQLQTLISQLVTSASAVQSGVIDTTTVATTDAELGASAVDPNVVLA